jgi:uncharacterized damage-inducible protein DinB
MDYRYPIGTFQPEAEITRENRIELLLQMDAAPNHLRQAVASFSPSQLDTPYRPEGWTVRQVVHHLADSHINWYVRTKLAITEEDPIVRSFDENLWAETPEARTGPVEPSLILLDGLYQRWTTLFRSLTDQQWSRSLHHPDRGPFVLDATLAMMVWHGQHHTAQITSLRDRMGWR